MCSQCFLGGLSCVVPIGWDASTKPWTIQICDPNFPGQVRNIVIDPHKNEYTYLGWECAASWPAPSGDAIASREMTLE